MPNKKPDRRTRWRIIHIKGTPAETIGYVHAPDAKAAIKKAIEQFGIANTQIQQRLIAEQIKVSALKRR
jgi:hypothetical protein